MDTYCSLDEAYRTPKDIEMLARSNYITQHNSHPSVSTVEYVESDIMDPDTIGDVQEPYIQKSRKKKHDTSLEHLESCKSCRRKVRKLFRETEKDKVTETRSGFIINGEEIKEMLVMVLVAILIFRLLDKVF